MASASDRLKETLRHYLDTSVEASRSLSKMTRSDLEKIVNDFTHSGTGARDRVEDAVEELRARSRRGAGQLRDLVRDEVRDLDGATKKRRGDLADFIENAASRLGDLLPSHREPSGVAEEAESADDAAPASVAEATVPDRRPKATATSSATPDATGKPARRAPTAAKRVDAEAAPAKKTAAKKTPATATVTRRPSTRATKAVDSPAKKTAATKTTAAAKKTAAPRRPAGS